MNAINAASEINPAPDSSFSLPPDTVAYYSDFEIPRNRLTTFFRYFCALPHILWLSIYGIGAFFAVFAAWFAIMFTARYPEGMYNFVVNFHRYYTRVYAYMYLITDKFPPFNGNPDEQYAAHMLIGPPKEKYSRSKTFFRGIIMFPFATIAYIYGFLIGAVIVWSWFYIMFTGRQSKGLQDLSDFVFSFLVRFGSWMSLLTEDWPKFSDEAVNVELQQRGYQGAIPPSGAAAAAIPAAAQASPPPPPAPPAPPQP